MIQSIDIPNFGSFRAFLWSAEVRDKGNNVAKFQKMNILYGRNYSGKTTLSRIVRCLETRELPPRYDEPDFTIHTSSGSVRPSSLDSAGLDVRVYNRDFVVRHLSFLTDVDGQITPFAVIGSGNTEIEKQIRALEAQLGTLEGGEGLRARLGQAEDKYLLKKEALNTAENDLERKLTAKATSKPHGMKHNSLFRDPNYNTPKIKADIATIRREDVEVLADEEKERRRKLLAEEPQPDVSWDPNFDGAFPKLKESTIALIFRTISPSTPIAELLEDSDLQDWVKAGMPLHRGVRTTCAFCNQTLPPDIWSRLDAHFDEESSALEAAIDRQLDVIEQERVAVGEIPKLDSDEFYDSLRPAAKTALGEVDAEAKAYLKALEALSQILEERKKDIFHQKRLPQVDDCTGSLQAKVAVVEDLVVQHNQKTGSLSADQARASEELRLNEVAEFIADIDLAGEEEKLEAMRGGVEAARSHRDGLRREVKTLDARMTDLRSRLKDESQGAEKVNEYLNHYFGHEGLRLESIDDPEESGSKFQVLRGDQPAYNLSEGECSLVAFCYFIARLEATDSVDKDLVVFIDDPVSSLDENHIFFVYSLIQSVLARSVRDSGGTPLQDSGGKPVFRYQQLFIATHNLEFLKYCKRLDRPSKDCEHFLVVAKGGGSAVELMPPYLREYVTEFNYLFNEIYMCMDPANQATHQHSFYGFGNNLRRFLEAFLFFKYPFAGVGGNDHKERVEQFFGGDSAAEPLVQRLTNEMSHLKERFDRGVQPVDQAEISKLATFVLRQIKENDSEQFRCLLESISQPDPFKGSD